MKSLLLLTLILISAVSYAQETIKNPELKKLIDSLAFVDQKVQQDFMESFQRGESIKYDSLQHASFIRHTPTKS